MYKAIFLAAILGVALCAPEPKADPKAKPGYIAAAYTAPVVAAPAVAYPSAYSAPLAYSAGYVAAPYAYSGYPAYSAYSSPYVVV